MPIGNISVAEMYDSKFMCYIKFFINNPYLNRAIIVVDIESKR